MEEPNCDTENPPKAVAAAANHLAAVCGVLHERLGELEVALTSVLRSPDPTTTGTEAIDPKCPLAGVIDDLTGRVFQASERVRDMISRLEL